MASKIEIELNPESAFLQYDGVIELSFTADISDILQHFTESQVIAHFGFDNLLDEIGQKEAADYFGLDEG